jgi:DNA-directed RNA polymerase specialized sigma24 family protein
MDLDFHTTSKTLLANLARPQGSAEWQASWALFVRKYGPPILRVCKRSGVRNADLEDVSQEVLLKLKSSMATFECRRWLKTVVERAMGDLFDELEQSVPGGDEARIRHALLTAGRAASAGPLTRSARDKLVAARVRQLLAQQTADEREQFRVRWTETRGDLWHQPRPSFEAVLEPLIERASAKWGLEGAAAERTTQLFQARVARVLETLEEDSLPRFRDWLRAVVRNAARDCLQVLHKMVEAGDVRIDPMPEPIVPGDDFTREMELREVRLEAERRVRSNGRVSERDWLFYTRMVHDGWTAPELSRTFDVANGAAYMAVKRVRDKVAAAVLLLEATSASETEVDEL